MRCKEIDGAMKIIEFPGGIPSQSDQDLWTQEYNNYLASEQYLDDKAESELSDNDALKIIVNAFLNHENRIRVLEGKTHITQNQLISALRKL